MADTLALLSAAAVVVAFELLHHAEFPVAGRRFLIALAITGVFALLAWFAGGVNVSGALAGSAVAFIMAIRDLRMFGALLLVFTLTLAATRIGYARKQQLRSAEPAGGRTAAQAMANLGVAALVVAIGGAGWPVLALSALAEAAADTGSSEIGMAFPGRTVLITTFKPVPAGTDGGISARGTLAALVAALAVASAAVWASLTSLYDAAFIATAGFLGVQVDSLLGAVFERRGRLNNDLVNLLSTAITVGIAWLLRRWI
ncbi:MAG TPA: DUF92 domain-containing protein [Candidatus Angelobacter sp.]|nr:DUF92 domain-containing protein [Candidatus Angelobacter sp.]